MRQNRIPRILPVAAVFAGLGVASPAMAQNISVTVDGEVVSFVGQQPVQRFGTVLVPLRGVFEKLGATVAYDGATKSILAVKGPTSVTLRLGDTAAQVNGQSRPLSQAAQAVNGTTLVPLRFVSEALGSDVKWRGASRTVVISTTGNSGAAVAGVQPAPGAGNPAAGTGATSVTSLTHSAANQALRAGDALTVTLQGTPGGVASFSIPGIETAQNVAMKETAPGTYVGTFTPAPNTNVKGASVLASLKVGASASPVIQAGQPLTVDAAGPVVGSLSPAPNASLAPGKPLIYGTLSDAGTGVDANATRIVLDGKDVTAQATVTEAFFSFRPATDLPVGKNTVSITARDAAGNETRRDWAFTVSPAETILSEVTFSPDTKTLEPGDVVTVRAKGQAGGKARFSIGGSVTDRPMQEESAGVYVGNYTVRKGDTLAQAPVTVAFTSTSGRTVSQTAGQSVTIAAGAPGKPVITSPVANAAVGQNVTITGKAQPNATVRYTVRYQGVLLVLPANGTVASGDVKADAQGNWKVENIALSSPIGVSRLTYSVEAAAIDAAGEVSEPATLAFRK